MMRPGKAASALVFAFAIVTVLGAATPATGQTSAACPDCGIMKTRLVVLGSPSDSVRLGPSSSPVRDSRGRYFVTTVDQRIMEFDSLGRFRRVFGRLGEGRPESFERIYRIFVGRGDSLFVYDGHRITVFSPSLENVRMFVLPPVQSLVGMQYLPDHRFVRAMVVRASDLEGTRPFTVWTASGQAITSFGERVKGSCSDCYIRSFAPGVDGSIWALRNWEYALELWSRDGELARTIPVSSRWFVPGTPEMPRMPDGKPRMRLPSLHQDGDNRLWVGGTRPTTDWRPSAAAAAATTEVAPGITWIGGPGVDLTAVAREAATTTVSAIDLLNDRGDVLASQQFEREVIYLMGPGLAFSRSFDANDVTTLIVWQLTPTRPRDGR
jgi:hypothetical protein